MGKFERVCSEQTRNLNISTISSNVVIYGDNVNYIIVRYSDNFRISDVERAQTLYISGENQNSPKTVNGNLTVGNLGISIKGCTFNDNSSLIRNYSGTSIKLDDASTSDEIEIIIPKRIVLPEIKVETRSGNISIRELFLERLFARTISGSVNLKGFDSRFTEINTESGNINAEIFESIFNYDYSLCTKYGIQDDKSDETELPIFLSEKHRFAANSDCGNIKVLFKGKRL